TPNSGISNDFYPGAKTRLGTENEDTLSTGANVNALYGGEGADTLTSVNGNTAYLVAGKDWARDTLIGNAGDDILVGYFNQNDYGRSDQMSGGGGDDTFVIIDPGSALAGGIPDINGTPGAPTDFTHAAGSDNKPTLIDGGAGHDVLDFSFLTNDVTLDFTNGSVVNVEGYLGSNGDDTIFVDAKRYILSGGDGVDTLSYKKAGEGIEITLDETIDYSASTVRAAGDGDWVANFVQFEKLAGSNHDDTVKILNSTNDIKIDGGAQGAGGDTLDFSAHSTGLTADLTPTNQGYADITMPLGATLSVKGFENVIGSTQNDVITGDGGDNRIDGGAGADVIDGGAGIDTLHFDPSGAGVTVNLEAGTGLGGDAEGDTYADIEVVIGTDNDDHLYATTTGNMGDSLAGGDGEDILEINPEKADNGQPDIIWGGADSDTFRMVNSGWGDYDGRLTIMVVKIPNLTAENFADINLDDLDLEYSLADVIIVNPDSSDRIEMVGYKDIAGDYELFTPNFEINLDPDGEIEYRVETSGVLNVDLEIPAYAQTQVGSYRTHNDDMDFTTPFWVVVGAQVSNNGKISSPSLGMYIVSEDSESFDGASSGVERVSYRGSTSGINVDLALGTGSGGFAEGDMFAGIFNIVGSSHADTLTGNGSSNKLVGKAGDDTISGGTGNDTLTGGVGVDMFTFVSGDGQDVITDFEVGVDNISIDGVVIDPNNLPDGVSVTQQASATGGFDLLISYGSEDSILLTGIDMDTWRPVVVTIAGTDQDDTLTGTSDTDVIAAGAGNDTISAGGGDDTIIYDSGDDVILGFTSNLGFDTLDLSKYTSDQVSFRIFSFHVIIATPDGDITLKHQVIKNIGYSRSNIEQVVFSDITLNELEVRNRAVADQFTDGDDNISASKFNDIITSGSGNDIIGAGKGDDLIIYESGNDVIKGYKKNGMGFDTLDLSKYAADDVSFFIGGNNVFITTPDGTIELRNQVKYEIGSVYSSINQIIFSDGALDEAGIKARALADQSTTGDDTISGTIHADVINTGAGNDTISGFGGADIFQFDAGDGSDIITDFEDGIDTIDFSATGLTFANLTISQNAQGDALIGYGATDSITLEGIAATQITADDFIFA
ncbi:MAG: hypothetical protein V3V13_03865, partial [Paracoccaceae bacterium]